MKNAKKLLPVTIILLFSFIIKIQTQNSTTITTINNSISLDYDGILGIGWGVFAIICSGILGIIICIIGFSTTHKAVFYSFGIAIPILIFLIMVLTPVQQANENFNISENQTKNPFAIIRYLILGLVATGLITLVIPFMKFWTVVLVPQRVDSRSHREYLEKQFKDFGSKNEENNQNEIVDVDKGLLANIISNQPQILSVSYSSNVNKNQQGDIEMANVENLVNKERKRKLKSLKRKRNEEDELI